MSHDDEKMTLYEFESTKMFRERVDEISDERRWDSGYIVYAKRGWAFDPHPNEKQAAHLQGFPTEEEVIKGVTELQECSCDYCKGLVD